ncbi:MAG: divalent-cation tolerance protein CutA [Rhodospirillaceae bacterium]
MDEAQQAVLIVMTNAPDRATAEKIGRALVDARVAACINVMSPCTSVYRWRGAVETAEEVPLFIKTTVSRYAAVEELIRKLHPYELPEIVAVPAGHGLPGYLAWVRAETTPGAA